MPHININTCNYYYETYGQGKCLVLIAGYSCDQQFWQPILNDLARHFQVVVFDNRAIGQTQDDGKIFSLEQMAEDTVQLINHLALSKPTIIGHSMGGMIAQTIAKKYPEQIEKLIVLNSASAVNTRSLLALEGFLRLLQEDAPVGTIIEASLPWFYSSTFLKNKENILAVKEAVLSNPHPQSLPDLSRQFQVLKSFDPASVNKNITVPTLVVSSSDDIICMPHEGKKLAESIPHAQFVTLQGGHCCPAEHPKAVYECIMHFCA